MRKVVFAIAAALAVTMFFVAPANGATHGTDRPFNGSGSGTATITTAGPPQVISLDGQLLASLTGRSTFHADISTPGLVGTTFTFTGTNTITAANGDTVAESLGGSGQVIGQNPLTETVTFVATITGGTGRFAGATGSTTVTGTLVQTMPTAFHITVSFSGTIAY